MRRQAILLLMALAGVLIVAGGVAYAASVECDGVGDQDPDPGQCTGTSDPDSIDGTVNPDKIKALGGNDFVNGWAGNDTVYGGPGAGLIQGNNGNDTIYGGPDDDGSGFGADFSVLNLEGQADSDKVYGGRGNDWIDAAYADGPAESQSPPVDESYGGRGSDHIFAIDNNEDIINCGKGKGDVALVDQEAGLDTTKGCEQRIVED